jgi:hypothetical protein
LSAKAKESTSKEKRHLFEKQKESTPIKSKETQATDRNRSPTISPISKVGAVSSTRSQQNVSQSSELSINIEDARFTFERSLDDAGENPTDVPLGEFCVIR